MLMQRGMQTLETEDYSTAADLFARAVSIQPGNVTARYLHAKSLAGMKRLKPAEAEYREALKIQPGHEGALLGLAAIDENTGHLASAEEHYREVIRKGTNPRAERGLAGLLSRTGRFKDAEAILSRLIAADPGDADSRFELGLALSLKGDCEAAIPEFRKVVAARPSSVMALFHLGNCLSRTGKTDEAATVLERFRATSEEEKRRVDLGKKVHFTLLEADELAEAGKMDAAVAKAREALKIDPKSARAHAFLGSLLMELGRNDEALASLKRASELDPSDAISLTEAGRLLALSGKPDEALTYFRKAVAADANLAEPHRFLALLYQQMGRTEDAEREKAIFLRLGGGR